jgi:hypothetical protein
MAIYALNRLPTRYVSTKEGETRYMHNDNHSVISNIVLDAINQVSKHPHRVNMTMTEYSVNELFDYIDKHYEEPK